MDEIYPISEDTLLVLRNLKCGEKVLEMGTGNGEIAIECAKRGSHVTAVDIDIDALEYAKVRAENEGLYIEFIHSNLFENVKGEFDTIIFNPPYLPGKAQELKDLQWAGGEYGDEITIKFLSEAYKFLKKKGVIYIVLSSFNRIDSILKMPYKFKLLDEMKLAFHTIYLYQARKN